MAVIPSFLLIHLEKKAGRQDDLFADALAVQITRDPDALMSAINKVSRSKGGIDYGMFGIRMSSGMGTNPALLPANEARYFFVNPLYSAATQLRERKDLRMDCEYRHRERPLLPYTMDRGETLLRAYQEEEESFFSIRIMALQRIKYGGSYGQGMKIPPSDWD